MSTGDSYTILKDVFGYSAFREGQSEIIDDILAGQNILAVMPTGAGKSLCYQIPALMTDGPAIIVSPLISLIENCLLYTSPSPRDLSTSRMPSSA